MLIYVYVCEWLFVHRHVGGHRGQKTGVDPLGSGVTGSVELPDLGVEN